MTTAFPISSIKGLLEDRKANEEDLTNTEFDSRVLLFSQTYKRFRDRVREGNYGRTAQFWLAYYLHVMASQHLLHMAIQENNFYLFLHGLRRMLHSSLHLTNKIMHVMDHCMSITWET